MGSTPSLQRDQFDFYGAEYVFVGVEDVCGSLTLDAYSAFFAAIYNGGSECCLAQVKSVAVVSRM